jgi:hypothetical protein
VASQLQRLVSGYGDDDISFQRFRLALDEMLLLLEGDDRRA